MARQVLDNGIVLPSEYSDDWYDDMTSNLTKLDEVIGSDAEKLSASDVGAAAISNDYDDLDNKPTYNILRRASVTLTAGGTGNYSDLDSDSKIKAGDYVLDAANKLYSITAIDAANSTYTVSAAALFTVTDKAELGAAALSNDYDDLNNLPGYGILRFCSTAITDNSNVSFANISSVSKIAAGDFLLDTAGKLYQIASVDTANETVSVTTPLTVLALDSGVMHLSGNETVTGSKTFSSTPVIYNSDTSGSTTNLYLRNQLITKGDTSSSGNQTIRFTDVNDKLIGRIQSNKVSNGASYLNLRAETIDAGNNDVTVELQILAGRDGSKSFSPQVNNSIDLGRTLAKWKNIFVNQINGLTPSSLSLPSGNLNDILDISSYIIDLSGGINEYTAPANGWITITCLSCTGIKFSITNFWANGSYRENPNQISCMIPICKSQKVGIYIYGSSPTIQAARFIPCQGNI